MVACCLSLCDGLFLSLALVALHAAAGRVSPRRATYLFAARPECRPQKARGKNVPCSQRPRKLRCANLSGQPAVGANAGVRRNSLRAKALRSNRRRKSVHEVWLSFGSQTASIYCDRRRWLKGVGEKPNSQQPTAEQPARAASVWLGLCRRVKRRCWGKWRRSVDRANRMRRLPQSLAEWRPISGQRWWK